jgi:broad specificity phosphatase PhoE
LAKLVFVRHAHRDTSIREADNGLSEKGWEQARAVAKLFEERFGDEKPVLLSSPKTRCRETLEPLSERVGVRIQIDPLLVEQEAGESSKDLSRRIDAFLERWKKNPPEILVACSHGDWLPLAIEELVDETVDLKKGAWAEISLKSEKPKLKELIQKP